MATPEKGIRWEVKDKSVSVVVWFAYDFLQDEHDEVIFDTHITGRKADSKPIKYEYEPGYWSG